MEVLMSLKQIQKEVWQNKLNNGFNTTDVYKEFCLLNREVSEAYEAHIKNKNRVYKNVDGVNIRIGE
jgi:hypothetical protein